VIGGAAVKMPRWLWARKTGTTKLADDAETARDKAHHEVVVPLRAMRSGDFLTPAVIDDIRRRQRE
jgi:hypothetical protein